jgi:hypothetical protein
MAFHQKKLSSRCQPTYCAYRHILFHIWIDTDSMSAFCRCCAAIDLLVLSWPSPGQTPPTAAYSEIVAERLSAEQVLLRSVRDSSDSLTAAIPDLNLQPIDSGNELAEWREAQDKADRGVQRLVNLLETEVAADDDSLAQPSAEFARRRRERLRSRTSCNFQGCN